MGLILCIETGTDVCSVGLAEDGQLTALRESDGRDHARNVAVYVDEMLRERNLSTRELDAVAVGKGPGSYTGLRIGVSFAKGLCYGLGIPLIAVGSLDSLVEVVIEDNEAGIVDIDSIETATLCPMIDARRMEVYTQLFDGRGVAKSEVEAKVIDAESFRDEIAAASEFVIFGNGAAKCVGTMPPSVKLIDVKPSARGMARLAQRALDEGRTEDVAYFEPFYLKDFVITVSKKKIF